MFIIDNHASYLIYNNLLCSCTRGDQKIRGKVLLNRIAFIDRNKNSYISTTIHSKLTEIEI